jgi:hypothetical protein
VTADLAILAMAAVSALQVVLDHRHRMKVADRERLVGPAKQPADPKNGTEAKTGEQAKTPALVPGLEHVA